MGSVQVGEIPEITTVAEGVAVAYLHIPNRVRSLWGESNGHQEARIWINPTEELGGRGEQGSVQAETPCFWKGGVKHTNWMARRENTGIPGVLTRLKSSHSLASVGALPAHRQGQPCAVHGCA